MQDIKDRVAEAKQAALEVTAGVLELRQTIKELTEREAKLVEALKFYADGDYQEGGGVGGNKANNFEIDYGQIATKKLEELGY